MFTNSSCLPTRYQRHTNGRRVLMVGECLIQSPVHERWNAFHDEDTSQLGMLGKTTTILVSRFCFGGSSSESFFFLTFAQRTLDWKRSDSSPTLAGPDLIFVWSQLCTVRANQCLGLGLGNHVLGSARASLQDVKGLLLLT